MDTPANRTPRDAPGSIGEYALLLPIATGGMGTVFLAEREIVPGVMRKFALKLLHPRLRAGDSVATELMREAQIAARVRDPHVVAVHEAGAEGAWLYLVMDYVDGVTLHAMLRAARRRKELLPLPIVGRILVDALTGLHAAHEARDESGKPLGIIHRDFSPQNILIGADGVTRLTDFGIAKAMGQSGATATGVVKGKVSYMAPEQAKGEMLDRRCDVWAAGAVAWEALAGERLFKGETDAECLLKIVSGRKPPSIAGVRPDVSSEIAAVVSQALVADKSARMADAAELAAAIAAAWGELAEPRAVALLLERLLGDKLAKRRHAAEQLSIHRRAARTKRAAEKAAPRRRRVALVAVTATAMAAALGIGWFLGRQTPAPSPDAAPAESHTEPPPSTAPIEAVAPEPSRAPVATAPAPPRAAPPARRTRPEPPATGSTRAPDRLLGRD